MSFWNLNDTTDKIETTGEFDSGAIDVLPDNTQLKASIDEAKWDSYDGEEYISLRWTVLAPDQFKNRKVFQKVKVGESDPKKQDKAKKMLAAIATNAGGGLLKESNVGDMELQRHLLNKPMVILVRVWEMDGKKGNWVAKVSPLKNATAPQVAQTPASASVGAIDDDVGF